MGHIEPKSSQGYGKPPWMFRGSALYQLHLVKAETARAFIPKEFRLVEAFGYTLGGFFLASYDESPAGKFDELVVIAGIVWNPPTSCAWAAKVLVNSHEACDHGRKFVGLPSQVARFSKSMSPISRQGGTKTNGFLSMLGIGAYNPKDQIDVRVSETRDPRVSDICNVNLTTSEVHFCDSKIDDVVPSSKSGKWIGPSIKMSLPSFSGCTQYHPSLLKYSCQIECRVQLVSPARVSNRCRALNLEGEKSLQDQSLDTMDSASDDVENIAKNLSTSVMLSKPILALEFSCLKMQVEAPVVISQRTETSIGYT